MWRRPGGGRAVRSITSWTLPGTRSTGAGSGGGGPAPPPGHLGIARLPYGAEVLPPEARPGILHDAWTGLGALHAAGAFHYHLQPSSIRVGLRVGGATGEREFYGVVGDVEGLVWRELCQGLAALQPASPEYYAGAAHCDPLRDQFALLLITLEVLSGVLWTGAHGDLTAYVEQLQGLPQPLKPLLACLDPLPGSPISKDLLPTTAQKALAAVWDRGGPAVASGPP